MDDEQPQNPEEYEPPAIVELGVLEETLAGTLENSDGLHPATASVPPL